MAELSIFEQQILAQFQADRDLLKAATIDWLQAGGGTQAQCEAMLVAIATPTPTIPDRAAMLSAYVDEVGAWENLCLLCALYPKMVLMQVASECGKPLPSTVEVSLWSIEGNDQWDIPSAPDAVGPTITRSPLTGLAVVERWSSSSLGLTAEIRRGVVDKGTHEEFDGTEAVVEV